MSSMALRPKGQACLSSGLLFSRTICAAGGEAQGEGEPGGRLRRSPVGNSRAPYSDVGIPMMFGQVEHVVQGQHAWRALKEVQGRIEGVLRKQKGLSLGPWPGSPTSRAPLPAHRQPTVKPSIL